MSKTSSTAWQCNYTNEIDGVKSATTLSQTILDILLSKNKLAYARVDDSLRVVETSCNFQAFFHRAEPLEGTLLPKLCEALIGSESVLREVMQGSLPEYLLEYVNDESGAEARFLTFHVWKNWGDEGGLFLLVEDVSPAARLEQRAVQARNELELLRRELDRANAELHRMALFDALTGLPNRRYLDEQLTRYVETARRTGTPFSLIMLDIDEFKAVNDLYGHLEGDDALRILASVLRTSIRNSDFVARYAGDEFCICLPMTESHQAHALAARIQRNLAEITRPANLRLTISLGIFSVSGQSPQAYTPQALLARADAALYRAKREGKNRICLEEAP
ncbi:MAG: GGDEF domain-containing protein [Anaerolineales bacterium]|nr:GGDEF domain-containing protein [Anaerolineales bacterium]MCX7754495.1 GGDEF domain-containing protein [Anaerolineales bacterium]MDW8277117.1 GGDEF domain-containing protein [Anaerolineales bacterium]